MNFIKNSVVYLGSSILNKGIPFLLLPILTKYLSPFEYGILSLFQVMVTFSTAIVGMVININVSKNFFIYEKKRMATLIGNILLVLCSTTTLVLIVTYIATLYFEDIFSIPSQWARAIPILSFMFMVNTINLSILRMEERAYTFGVFEVTNTILNMGLTILLLTAYGYGWYSRAIGISIAYFIFFLISMVHMKQRGYLHFNIDYGEIKSILKVSLPLIPHALGGIVISISDRFFIESLVGLEAVGIYSVGYMFGMIVMLFTDAFLKAWSPWFFKNLAQPSKEKKHRIVRYTYLYLLGIIFLALVVSLAGEVLLPYFVDQKFYGASSYIVWIAFGYVFFGVYQIFFPYLVHIGKTSFLAVSTTVAALVNLVLNYFLIKVFGAIGAAYATIVAFAISSTMVFLYQKRKYRMPWLLKNQ